MGSIVFFGPGFQEVGGAQKRAWLLTSGLAQIGWEVRAINRAGTRRSFVRTSAEGLHALDVPGFGTYGLGALLYLTVGGLLGMTWAIKSTALVAMQVGTQSLLAAFVGALLRKPFVVLSTSSGRLSELELLKGQRLGRVRRWAMGRAALVVVQTEAAAEELTGIVDQERIRVLPNPVEAVMPRALTGAPHALFMGRLSEEKDLPNLLAAWGEVAVRRPGARLILLGEGGHFRSVEPLLRETIASDPVLRSSVEMKGWVAEPLVELQSADVFVFPSLSEGMSNSLLEACAAGRIVAASAIPSNIAVLGRDYPLLFPPSDRESLATTLLDAFNNEDKRRLALETIRTRMELFSVDRVLGLFEGMLLECARSRT